MPKNECLRLTPQFSRSRLENSVISCAQKALRGCTSNLPIKPDEVALYEEAVLELLGYKPSKKPHRNLAATVDQILQAQGLSKKILIVTKETPEHEDPASRQFKPLKFRGITFINRGCLERDLGAATTGVIDTRGKRKLYQIRPASERMA